MGRIYTAVLAGTITNAGGDCDLFTFKPAANKPIRLRGLILSQYSELGDSAEEALELRIVRLPATVTDGSGGSAIGVVPVDENDAAAGFTCRGNDTTLATTSGSAAIIDEFSWNERNSPYERWWPDDEFAPRVQNAGAICVRMLNTLADDISAQLTAYVEEY